MTVDNWWNEEVDKLLDNYNKELEREGVPKKDRETMMKLSKPLLLAFPAVSTIVVLTEEFRKKIKEIADINKLFDALDNGTPRNTEKITFEELAELLSAGKPHDEENIKNGFKIEEESE